ncbi:AAA family ATPase [Myroides sp. WP-1]|uniref:AAA family ATPase n=1 Tax=Myroides sp. WP-1 TaxID=2759944 RepID=UPI0015FDDC4A|nr:AAA family ATPase [Myroides sp. WP-1]MBB1140724.1 ATP-binding protein [Myroides sp. WP-1]
MSLVYLYIDSYRNFNKQSINFGDKYTFNYDEISKELKQEDNKLYLDNFYSVKDSATKTKITNVTSIVGANGSGKSSILNFLLGGSLNIDIKTPFLYDFILIYKLDSKYIAYCTEGLVIERHGEISIESLNKKDNRYYLNDHLFRGVDDNISIYLSNIMDFNVFFSNISSDKLINLSSNYLMKNNINQYLKEDLNLKVKLIASNLIKNERIIPFELPKELQIISSYDYWGEINSDESTMFNRGGDYFIELKESIKSLTNTLTSLKSYEDGLNRILYNSLLQYLSTDFISPFIFIEESKSPINEESLAKELIIIKEFCYYINLKNVELAKNIEYPMIDIRNLIIDILDNLLETSKESDKLSYKYLEKRIMFLKYIYKIPNLEHSNSEIVLFEISDALVNNLNTYFDSVKNMQYIDFKFRDLSSGEGALLSIFSRLYSLRVRIDKGIYRYSKNLTLIFDEFDLYMHPHWQKKFLKILIEFLTEIYIGKNIQIIFATNSPIPISDVLGYNMVFLETENGNSAVRTTLNEQHDTFAANIHTLYSDSFFIQDGLIGDFAKTKINEVISYLKDKSNENPFKNGTELRQFILQIGEPLIKNKLLTMYNDKNNLSIHERLDKIEKKIGLDND